MRKPRAVQPAQHRRHDEHAVQRLRDRERDLHLLQLKLHEVEVRLHELVLGRFDRRKRLVRRGGEPALSKPRHVHDPRHARRVAHVPGLGLVLLVRERARAFAADEVKVPAGRVPEPRVGLAHPMPFPRRASELKRVVHRERRLLSLAVRPLRVERVPVTKLRHGQRAEGDGPVVRLEEAVRVRRRLTRAAFGFQVVERVLVPHGFIRLDRLHPLLGQRARAGGGTEEHDPDVGRRVARVRVQAVVVVRVVRDGGGVGGGVGGGFDRFQRRLLRGVPPARRL
mmetsp:Transcript_14199/g.51037  ORF Transcript_14199/g.51037 Transcript_14199/m.51037 type:complete len:282 (-) Transcript_14199:757-1602(-)